MKRFIITLLVISQFGCATIFQGGPDTIQINSNPEGARVYLNGYQYGVTPTHISLRHNDDALIQLKKEGYETITINKGKVLNGWFIGDFFFITWIPLAVDLITYNQGKYSEDPIFFQMEANPEIKTSSAAQPAPTP